MNTDYTFDVNRKFPEELLNFDKGIIDLHRIAHLDILGGACVFDPETYITINGFPNDLVGWGGDDWAVFNRLKRKNIEICYPPNLSNSGFIIENSYDKYFLDETDNEKNIDLGKRDDIETNGLTTCVYKFNSAGEFHNETRNVYHYLYDL